MADQPDDFSPWQKMASTDLSQGDSQPKVGDQPGQHPQGTARDFGNMLNEQHIKMSKLHGPHVPAFGSHKRKRIY